MMNETKTTQLKKLLMGYLLIAKNKYSDEVFEQLQSGRLQSYIALVNEAVPIEYLVDPVLIHHALNDLSSGRTNEEAIIHAFALAIYKMMTSNAKLHPLELGIIKQQISGVVPLFNKGVQEQTVHLTWYKHYAEPLLAIVEEDKPAIEAVLADLKQDYLQQV